MARRLNFSNGELHVSLNGCGLVDSLTFPYVGSETHTADRPHKIGVWVDDQLSWLDDGSWTHKSRLPHNSLVGHTVMVNESLGIILELEDFVDSDVNAFIRNVHVINIQEKQRSVRLFFHQSLCISNSLNPDTAQYRQDTQSILHYGGRRAFSIGGMTDVGKSFDQHSVGLYGDGRDGTWRDAEDGKLSGSSVESGNTDSTIRFSLTIGGLSSRRVHYWAAAGTSVRASQSLASELASSGVYKHFNTTNRKWDRWLSPSFKITSRLPVKLQQVFVDSMIQLRSSIDSHGAIIDVCPGAKESYFSPQVGASVAWPLIRLGYKDEVMRYLNFCRQAMSDEGYLLSGYRADGAHQSTSLEFIDDIEPISGQQTALTLFVFTQVYALNKRSTPVRDLYKPLVAPMANFLAGFTENGLPLPSYSASGNSLETSTYATSVTYSALLSAAEIADSLKDQANSVKWRTAADDMKRAAIETLFNDNQTIKHSLQDDTPSISGLFGAFMFGLVDISDDRLAKTARAIERDLREESGLFTSREDRVVDYIGSLWMSQYYMEIGRDKEAYAVISQVAQAISHGDTDSIPTTGIHAEVISALLDTLTRK